MRLTLRHAMVAMSLWALSLAACTDAPTVPTAGTTAVPAAGTTVDAQFWKDYQPTIKKGMAWTFVDTLVTGDKTTTGEISEQVTDVQGEVATVKITGKSPFTPDATLDSTATRSVSFAPEVGEGVTAVYKSEGAVDVTVPFKSFKGAAKLSLAASGSIQSLYVYAVKGVGMVKLEMKSTASGTTVSYTRELKDFVSP